jgi:hypothetical protein
MWVTKHKPSLIVGLIVVVIAGAAWFLLLRQTAGFSDAPEAGHVALSQEGGVADVHYATCRASETPRLLVWEGDDGRRRWATFFRTGTSRSAYWLTRREDGVTYEPDERDELGPVEEARITVHLMPEASERVEVVDLPFDDLPNTDDGDVLLADGSSTQRETWLSSVRQKC